MTLTEAIVWVFWGIVVLATVRMLVASRRSDAAGAQLDELRAELKELRAAERLDALEAGQRALTSKVESAKVAQLRGRGVFR